jgi:Alpha amylase, catalytic domain
VANVFENRKRVEANIITSHGEAGQYFVTFLDNHDQPQRFGYTGPTQLTDQIVLGLGLLFGVPGIPCVYYGTEQGLSGYKTAQNTDDSMVREALWGKMSATGQSLGFDASHPLYVALRALGQIRSDQPALRYGRYYFRPLSGDGTNFGLSTFPTGVLAFSRILNDQEVIVIGNTIPQGSFAGEVIVDANINGANPETIRPAPGNASEKRAGNIACLPGLKRSACGEYSRTSLRMTGNVIAGRRSHTE